MHNRQKRWFFKRKIETIRYLGWKVYGRSSIFGSNDIISYLYRFDNLSSFYKSTNFDETIVTAEHQVGQAINFGITFNDAVAINGLQFAPISCEVINVNNEQEVYDLWDSSDDVMCNAENHPVNFQVLETPETASNDLLNQFYGFKYTGNILNIIRFFLFFILF